MTKREENIFEMTLVLAEHQKDFRYHLPSSLTGEELKGLVDTLADRFEQDYAGADWCELDYLWELRKYVLAEVARKLWQDFGDVPMNPETECLEEDWNGFDAGTFRENIWQWFEEEFPISVAELMGQV